MSRAGSTYRQNDEGDQENAHIPRPPNAFFIFRSDFYAQRKHEFSGMKAGEISKMASTAWKNMSDIGKVEYQERATKEKSHHLEKHPGYTYKPARKVPVDGVAPSPKRQRSERGATSDGQASPSKPSRSSRRPSTSNTPQASMSQVYHGADTRYLSPVSSAGSHYSPRPMENGSRNEMGPGEYFLDLRTVPWENEEPVFYEDDEYANVCQSIAAAYLHANGSDGGIGRPATCR